VSERKETYIVTPEAPVSHGETQFTHEPYSRLPLPDTSHLLTFTIGLPVPANNAYPTSRTGHRYTSSRAKAFKQAAGFITHAARLSSRWESGNGPLGLRLVLWFKDNRRTDIDGRVKLAQDAICEALHVDDSCIHELHVYRAGISPDPRCECTVWRLI